MTADNLSAQEINDLINRLIDEDAPLRAIEAGDQVYLAKIVKTVKEYVMLNAEARQEENTMKILHEYAVYMGYTQDDLEDWLKSKEEKEETNE